jgi:ferredoxin-NADP reductase
MQKKEYAMDILTTETIAPNVRLFNCQLAVNDDFSYAPGQFITLLLHDNKGTFKRSYSIANPPNQEGRIEFATSYVPKGRASMILFNDERPKHFTFIGPFGRLLLKDPPPKRYIFLSTSTGITPFISMLPHLSVHLLTNPNHSVILCQGVRQREDILYQKELLQFQTNHPNASVYFYLSREKACDATHFELSGYIQQQLEQIAVNPDTDMFYLCGNPKMIDDAFDNLKQKGIENHQIIREKYISGSG